MSLGWAMQVPPRKLSRKLLRWLASRGDQRLVATLLELESAFHDGIEAAARCSLETVADTPPFSGGGSTDRSKDPPPNCNKSDFAPYIAEVDGVDSVGKFFSGAIDQLIAKAQERSGLEPVLLLSALAQVVTEKRWQLGVPVKMRDVEREIVVAALRANGGNRPRTATELGIGRRRLDYRLKPITDKTATGL